MNIESIAYIKNKSSMCCVIKNSCYSLLVFKQINKESRNQPSTIRKGEIDYHLRYYDSHQTTN
jgi:hypothetical protein